MDAFYASVEIRENPELRGLPVVVGGDPGKRGVVAAASYEARRYGVHSAMPSLTAVRLCPQLVFVSARHDLYTKVSHQIHEIFERYTPTIEPLALDEAFLDISACRRLWGGAEKIGRCVKTDIRKELDLTASVGIAPNKFLAKLASDLNKPDGLVVIHDQGIQSMLDPLPVRKIWGVGKSGERRLQQLGIRTISDMRKQAVNDLEDRFGVWGRHIWTLAHGIDDREVITDTEAKSISHETTFEADIADREVLSQVLLELIEQVAARLRRNNRYAATVNVKIRYADFTTVTRAHSSGESTNITREIWHAARKLMNSALAERQGQVRLLGVGVSNLHEQQGKQTDLFDEVRARQRGLDQVTDAVNRKFGSRLLHRGSKQKHP